MRLSKADFQAIKAKTAQKKAKRALRVAENAGIALAATGEAPRCPAKAPKARKPGPMSHKLQIKAIKHRILDSGGFWSQAVRKRDGHKCVMCGTASTLQAHHYLFHRAHSAQLAVDMDNGVTLCYTCHIIRVHQRADGDFIAQLLLRMRQIVGDAKTELMRVLARQKSPDDLEFWQAAEKKLKRFLSEIRNEPPCPI